MAMYLRLIVRVTSVLSVTITGQILRLPQSADNWVLMVEATYITLSLEMFLRLSQWTMLTVPPMILTSRTVHTILMTTAASRMELGFIVILLQLQQLLLKPTTTTTRPSQTV